MGMKKRREDLKLLNVPNVNNAGSHTSRTHSAQWVCGRLLQSHWEGSGEGSQSRRGSRATVV